MEAIVNRARIERRREQRYAADIASVLLWDGISQPVTIRNISIYGALLRGVYLPTVGTRVTIVADHLEVCGTVIWLGADQCGVLLSSPIEPLALIRDQPIRTIDRPPPTITLRRIGPEHYA